MKVPLPIIWVLDDLFRLKSRYAPLPACLHPLPSGLHFYHIQGNEYDRVDR